ncbi:tyrosine-type recombinase/integrase [Nitratireductor aquibiodomus]|uniref:tyrosine-type recombinase/integrase n=1 Tax=Nitratireductor aquibiodomus TaxID=204799 RepID=UPI001FEECF76|nr:tyrosine-type recombinase/integrase [Nitratireductor aquibiodomus]
MARMPRPRKPFTQREVTRHGVTVWYFRRGKGPRIRLPGPYGSEEFNAAYEAAMAGAPVEKKATAPRTSLRWLVDRYMESGRFSRLAPETQKFRQRILLKVCETGGAMNFHHITKSDIQQGKVRREATPFAAQNYVKVMKALFQFAVDSAWIDENPAANVKGRAPETDGFHTWTLEEVIQYQNTHPVGTQARLALDLLLYTGLRRADAVIVGRQHIKDGKLILRTSKNKTEVVLPILPPLAASISATKTGDLALLCTSRGKPWVKESFGAWFAEQCAAANVPGRAHGLRKAGATFAAENGATEIQLAAMYGWKNPRMAERYTRRANRSRLAEQASNALFPNLETGAGNSAEKPMKSKAEN